MCRTQFCTRCQTTKRNQFEILFHFCFLPYQNLKSCENFYDNAVRLSAEFISKLLFQLLSFTVWSSYAFKILETSEKPNHKSKASPKPILPHLHILFCPSTLMKVVIIITLKCNTDCSQSHFRSLMIGDIYSCHNISQVSATLGPQALSAQILKLERRG